MILNFAPNILTGIFEAIMMFVLLNAYLDKRENWTAWGYGFGIVVLAILINLCNQVFNLGLLNVTGMIVSILILSYLFAGNFRTRFLISISGVLIIVLCELVVMFMIASLGNITASESVNNPQLRLLGIVISKLLLFAVIKIIVFNRSNTGTYLKTSYWLLFFMILSTSMLAVYLIFKLQYDSGITTMNMLSVICTFGLLYSTFFALYLYEHMGKQAQIINQQQRYELQMKDQTKHLEEIMLSQKQLKSFRHDLSNHLISLKTYFEQQDFKEGIAYIKNIDTIMLMNNTVLNTGNVVLDAIINTKKAIAESKNIKFTSNLQIPENIPIEATDICIIWGNALDNAIEACEKVASSDKHIIVSLIYENSSVICKIVNTNPNSSNLHLKTTKEDKNSHGFGIANIKMALEKYNSVLRIKQDNDEFILSIIIFLNK